jgi:tellurite methyltransferase
MPASKTDWDAKYRAAAATRNDSPGGIVQELLPLLPRKGVALDVACGAGRHSVLLAASGYSVMELLEQSCQGAGFQPQRVKSLEAVNPVRQRGIQLLQANLEQLHLPNAAYDLILCINYLQRSLFPKFVRSLRPGGFLIFETFTRANLGRSGGPQNPDYLLGCGELRRAFPGLNLIFYRELQAGQGAASLLAQKPRAWTARAI